MADTIDNLGQGDTVEKIGSMYGKYTGSIFIYLYAVVSSNTNSRRSRAGRTFELIIYKIYELLGYEFDSQEKAGVKAFAELGMSKSVDSILPNIDCYKEKRNKTIIGTMKTSLRERWQQVVEELERTPPLRVQ